MAGGNGGVEIPISFDWSRAEATTSAFIHKMEALLSSAAAKGPAAFGSSLAHVDSLTGAAATSLAKSGAPGAEGEAERLRAAIAKKTQDLVNSLPKGFANQTDLTRNYVRHLQEVEAQGKRHASLAKETADVAQLAAKEAKARLASMRGGVPSHLDTPAPVGSGRFRTWWRASEALRAKDAKATQASQLPPGVSGPDSSLLASGPPAPIRNRTRDLTRETQLASEAAADKKAQQEAREEVRLKRNADARARALEREKSQKALIAEREALLRGRDAIRERVAEERRLARESASGGAGKPPVPPRTSTPPEDPNERRRRDEASAWDAYNAAKKRQIPSIEKATKDGKKEAADHQDAERKIEAAKREYLKGLQDAGKHRQLTTSQEAKAQRLFGYVPGTEVGAAQRQAAAQQAAVARQAAQAAAQTAAQAAIPGPLSVGSAGAAALLAKVGAQTPVAQLLAAAFGGGGGRGGGGGFVPPSGGFRGGFVPPSGDGGKPPFDPDAAAEARIESTRNRADTERALAARMQEYLNQFGPLTRLIQERKAQEAEVLAADGRLHRATVDETRSLQIRKAKEAELLAADNVLHQATVAEARAKQIRAVKEAKLTANDRILQDARGVTAALKGLGDARASVAESSAINIAGADGYYRELGQGAAATKERNQRTKEATERETTLNQAYIDSKAATVKLEEERRVRTKAAEHGVRVSPADSRTGLGVTDQERGRVVVAERIATERRRTAQLREEIAAAAGLAEAELGRKNAERALKNALHQETVNLGGGVATGGTRGTRFQRLNARFGGRFGGQGARDPEDQQKLGQFMGSRFINSVGYSLSGGLIYGTVRKMREMIKEAESLERELAILKGQFDVTFGEQAGHKFEIFREGILGISRDTGVMADEVTRVARQLAGVFQEDLGTALEETKTGLRFGEITGLPSKEIGDSFLAISLAFSKADETGQKVRLTNEQIADSAIGLKNALSVPAGEIVQFTADLAPLASELGFTLDQINGLAAIAIQSSGRSAAVSSEQLSRALASIQEKYQEIIGAFQGNDALPQILEGYGEGDIAKVFEGILRGYDKLSDGAKSGLINQIGGPRQAAVVAAVFGRSEEAIKAFSRTSADNAGSFEAEWEKVSKTVSLATKRMSRAFEEFGLKLFEVGLADAISLVAGAGAGLFTIVTKLLSLFTSFNSALGGVPGKLLLVALGMRAVAAVMKEVQTLNLLQGVAGFAGGVGGRFGGLTRPGSVFSAYSASGAGVGPFPGVASRYGTGTHTNRYGTFATGLGNTRFGGGAGAGGFVAGAGGIAAGLAVPAALIGVQQVQVTSDRFARQLREQAAELYPKLRDAVQQDPSIARGKTGTSYAERVQFTILRTKSPGDLYKDALQEATAAQKIGALREIAANEKNVVFPGKGREAEYKQGQFSRAGRAADKLERDPTSDEYNEFADHLIDDASRDKATAGYVALGKKKGAAKAKLAADGAKALADLKSLEDDPSQDPKNAAEQFRSGKITEAAAAKIFKTRIDQIQKVVRIGRETGNVNAKIEADALALEAEYTKLNQLAISKQDQTFDFRDSLGEDTLQSRLAQARANALNANYTPETRRGAIDSAIKLQREVIQDKLAEAAKNNTDTAQERLRILSEGLAVPEELRRVSLELQLGATDERKLEITNLARVMAKSIDETTKLVIDNMFKFGQSAKNIQIALAEAALAELRAAQALPGSNAVESAVLADRIAAAEAAVAGLKTSTNPLGAAGVTDPKSVTASKEEKAAAQLKVDEELRNRRRANFELQKAQANGDPLRVAQADLGAARYELSVAKETSEKIQARARILQAEQALDKAYQDIASARRQLLIAQTSGDPIKQAYLELAAADAAVAEAQGEAARIQALIQRISAENKIKDLMKQLFQSQIALAQATAAALGDSVEVARLGLQGAEGELARLLATSTKPDENPEVNQARAAVITARRNLNRSILTEQEQEIQFQLQMGQVTAGQAIEMYRALLAIPTNTEEDIREIQLAIKQLTDQLGQDLQFNLPDLINLPTLYEARRLNQTGTGSTYQDARTVTITLNATNAVDGEAAVQTIVDAINTPRYGTAARLY